jgi:hypothetical protein
MTTTLESTQREVGEDRDVVVVPIVARALPVMTARLRARYPAVPGVVVERHISVAAAHFLRQSRIHDFLPILIERRASASLAGCVHRVWVNGCAGPEASPDNPPEPQRPARLTEGSDSGSCTCSDGVSEGMWSSGRMPICRATSTASPRVAAPSLR